MPWRLFRGQKVWDGAVPARAVVNSPGVLLRMVCSGVRIVSVADEFIGRYLRSGQLLPVLPDWCLLEVTACAVFQGRRLLPGRTRVFLDALEQYFSPAECQEHSTRIKAAKAQYRYDPKALQPAIAAERATAEKIPAAAPRSKRWTLPA